MIRASDICDTAAGWLIRLEGQTSPELWDTFQAWLDADPRHRAAFIRLREAWSRVGLLKNLRPADGTIDADLLAPRRISARVLGAHGFRPLRSTAGTGFAAGWRPAFSAAAVVAVGAAAWLGFNQAGWNSYQTGIGAREEISLTDGSTVDLNTNTELSTHISGSRREIKLTRGEALFHVAHDSTRPFFVTAGGTVVRAVGTAFSVRIRDSGEVDVLVSEGRVAVASSKSAATARAGAASTSGHQLGADEEAELQRSGASIRSLSAAEVSRKLAWTAGHLAFQGETLLQAIGEFNRYNQRQIAVVDPTIAQLRVGGTFRVNDPDSFVAALQHSFGIRAIQAPAGAQIQLRAASADE